MDKAKFNHNPATLQPRNPATLQPHQPLTMESSEKGTRQHAILGS